MVRQQNYYVLRAKSKCWIILIFLTVFQAYTQRIELQSKTDLSFTPEQISCDTKGNVFMSDASGNIFKHDRNGLFLNLYSTKRLGKIYALEANQGFRIFAFYQDLQEYLLIDQFLSNERHYQIERDSYIRIATLSQDLNIWAIDERDLQLSKISSVSKQTIYQNQWANQFPNEKINIQKITEVKSKLYLYDEGSKAYVFDNIGNYLSFFDLNGSIDVAADGSHLFCIYPNKLEIIRLEDGSVSSIELENEYQKIAIQNHSIYLVRDKTLEIYTYIPL